MSSLRMTCSRCVSTVRTLTDSLEAMSRLLRPSAMSASNLALASRQLRPLLGFGLIGELLYDHLRNFLGKEQPTQMHSFDSVDELF